MKHAIILTSLALTCASIVPARAEVTRSPDGKVTRFTDPTPGAPIDYAHAKAMPLPTASIKLPRSGTATPASPGAFGPPGVSGDAVEGSGVQSPVTIPVPAPAKPQIGGALTPFDLGTSTLPFSTAEVDAKNDVTSSHYPFRATGTLYFLEGGASKVCSASLIKPGVIVTAAHCVTLFGSSKLYSGFQFHPAYASGTDPYGYYTAKHVRILTSYYNGTDKCSEAGVVCQDDIAVIVLNKTKNAYPGPTTGWYNYGYNGYGYNKSSQVHVTQLGYSNQIDDTQLMERNDAQGTLSTSDANNTEIGSLLTHGSSGGPWLVNLGMAPTLSGGLNFGQFPKYNVVVGVTSFGSNDPAYKREGASYFTSNNIVPLVADACGLQPDAC